jgi:spore maturation protein CgeB
MAFPEELLHWIKKYDDFPKEYSIGFLGCVSDDKRKRILEFLANHYPDSLLSMTPRPSGSSPKPVGRFSRDEYYRMLQKCRIVLSLAGEGNDTFRFWENAACNAIHVSAKTPQYIPHDFVDAEHIFRFQDIDGLRKAIDVVLEDKHDTSFIVTNGRQHLINHHLTTGRATYFIDRMKSAFES